MYRPLRPSLLAAFAACLATASSASSDGFRVLPYLQDPGPTAMTVAWVSDLDEAGQLTVEAADGSQPAAEHLSTPERAQALAYPEWESDTFFDGAAPAPPYLHRVPLTDLEPRTSYRYTVRQGSRERTGTFTTAPAAGEGPVRLVFLADSESEPESTGDRVEWADPGDPASDRRYPIDQTLGFANNLEVILQRAPDLIALAGDLVESGGEQRDWDEFWRHLGDVDGTNLAGRIPLLAAPGNHEYYEGPRLGRYQQLASERAVSRMRTYFSPPDNGDPDPEARDRYYRADYGPVTLIALDVTNGSPHRSANDTNFFLLGAGDAGGGHSPGFGDGTRQHAWLEEQLADAQRRSAFTFVFFHHVPYSVGPHGWPAGDGEGEDSQSGTPVRELTPLFLRYGVDAVIAGHDEMWERSEIEGRQELPGGQLRPHTLQVLDVGVAGDGLRGPQEGLDNPHQRFLVHSDAPEVWRDGVLVSGGKHYGHLEVDVLETREGGWHAVLKPVHLFPRVAADGTYQGYERRLYDDVVTLTAAPPSTAVASGPSQPAGFGLERPFPNPFNRTLLLRFRLEEEGDVRLDVYDTLGQRVRRLVDRRMSGGDHSVEWDAADDAGRPVASGVYLFALRAGALRDTVEASLVR